MVRPAATDANARYQKATVFRILSATFEPIGDCGARANVLLFFFSIGLVVFKYVDHFVPVYDKVSAVLGNKMEIMCSL